MPFTISDSSIIIIHDRKTITVPGDSPDFMAIAKQLLEGNMDAAVDLATPKKRLTEWSEGSFAIKDGRVTYHNEELPSDLGQKVWAYFQEGQETFKALLNFWARLSLNPSWRSVNQLYRFICKANLPISPDGYAYAYKSVRPLTFRDWHSNTLDNSPGLYISYPRNKISDDPEVSCHEGLHIGGWDYVKNFHTDGLLLIVRYDPADVVSVPKDFASGKVRVCAYESIGLSSGRRLPSLLWDHTNDSEGCLLIPRVGTVPTTVDVEFDEVGEVDEDEDIYPDAIDDEDSDEDDFDDDDSEEDDEDSEEDSEEEEDDDTEAEEEEEEEAPKAYLTETSDLDDMDRYELRDAAKPYKIPGASKMGKADLKVAIIAARAATKE